MRRIWEKPYGKANELDKKDEERVSNVQEKICGQLESVSKNIGTLNNEMSRGADRLEVRNQSLANLFAKQKKEIESTVINWDEVLKFQPHQQVDARVAAEDKSEGRTNQIHEEIKTAEGKTVEVQIEAEEDVCKVEVKTEELEQIMEEEVEVKTEERGRIMEVKIEDNIQGCEEKILVQDEVEKEEGWKMSPSVKNGVTPVMPPKSLKDSEDGKENPHAIMRAAERHLALINTVEGHRIQFSYLTLERNARTWTGIFNAFPKFLKQFEDKIFVRDLSEETRINFKINPKNSHYNYVIGSISEYVTKSMIKPKTSFVPRNYQGRICISTRQCSVTTQNLLCKASHTDLGRCQKVLEEHDCTLAGTPKKRNGSKVNMSRMERSQGRGNEDGMVNQWDQRRRGRSWKWDDTYQDVFNTLEAMSYNSDLGNHHHQNGAESPYKRQDVVGQYKLQIGNLVP